MYLVWTLWKSLPCRAIALRTSASEKSVRIFVGHCVFCSECAMICPVSAITMSKVWDTVVTDRLSRDTMSDREIKRRPRPKEKQASSSVQSESQAPTAEDPRKRRLQMTKVSHQRVCEAQTAPATFSQRSDASFLV